MIGRIADGRFCIVVNANQTPARQRFTIVHELGHYMLHRH
ncbi:ImmA/IrrE family metallo-endopeptidase [Aerobium aerolatum]